MKLKTRTVYIYYDFPIIFSATNEEGNIFICFFADESDSCLKYFCKEISYSILTDLENNRKDIRSIFENPGKLYSFNLNAQSEEPVEAVETSEAITQFLPEKDLFIGGAYKSETPQTIVISNQSHLIEFNFNFDNSLSDYYIESPMPRFQVNINDEASFSGDFEWLIEAA
jgi:hypothetical protein